MAKKEDRFYFDNFSACAGCALEAAQLLTDFFGDFSTDRLLERLEQMHHIENRADTLKHDMSQVLVKAFITPIEREDIMLMSQNIDEVTDTIEEVLQRVYIHNLDHIHQDAAEFAALIVESCRVLVEAMKEFADFKKSKTLHSYIVKINDLENQADKLFIKAMARVHREGKEPLGVFAWHEVYSYLERSADAIEHVADAMETVIMKNS